MKNIAVLGCTGSIGKTTLSVLRKYREDFRVVLLANFSRQNELILLKKEFSEAKTYCYSVSEDKEYLSRPETYENVDVVINGIAGIAGLLPSYAVLSAGKILATANKESLVCAGSLLSSVMQKTGAKIYPLDSEHSAVWQCLGKTGVENVKKIVLTASGGAFRDFSKEKLASAPASLALQHPNWTMGPKVTVDCATLVNKGMEIIEAKRLFGIENVTAVRHDESIIHALVETDDNSFMAMLSSPDMTLPIQYALLYPHRRECDIPALSIEKISCLHFSPIDEERFPGFTLCMQAAERGDMGGTVLNAADEVLVNEYLSCKTTFYGITDGIEECMKKFSYSGDFTEIGDVIRMDMEVR